MGDVSFEACRAINFRSVECEKTFRPVPEGGWVCDPREFGRGECEPGIGPQQAKTHESLEDSKDTLRRIGNLIQETRKYVSHYFSLFRF